MHDFLPNSRHGINVSAPKPKWTCEERLQKLVQVSGSIATGKTSVVRRLANKYGWASETESIATNPYLDDFYRDTSSWALQTQLRFLADRVRQFHALQERPVEIGIVERSIWEDRYVFAELLHTLGYLSPREYETYISTFEKSTTGIHEPNVIVYLHASPHTLLERIKRRGRPFEQTITQEYLQALERQYSEWISSIGSTPTLKINTERQDLRKDEEIDWLAGRIKKLISRKYSMLA